VLLLLKPLQLIFCFLKFEIKLIRFADEGSVRNEGRRRIKDEFQAGPVFKASLGKKLAGCHLNQ
jgi:hypothetical protein